MTFYDNELKHHGILGMKWGIRRYQNEDGTLTAAGRKRYQSVDIITSSKTGDKLYVNRLRSKDESNRDYAIYHQGKKVANLFLEEQGDSLYVNWIDVKSTQRGKGYASSIMDYVIESAKKDGFKFATLEVPEGDDDARHIYEKRGFVAGKTDEYGVLTSMKKQIR